MEEDEAFAPVDVRCLRPQAVMPHPDRRTYLVEQPGRTRGGGRRGGAAARGPLRRRRSASIAPARAHRDQAELPAGFFPTARDGFLAHINPSSIGERKYSEPG